ncbi:MAG: thymidylate kinase [Eubacteriales bacterium]|nr:thymidylate kinase [Eubacteriales bacterium]
MMGILIAVEGVDASGKQTQTELLYQHLINKGIDVRRLSFPVYTSDSSAGVRMYLNGELSERAEDITAYAASSLFAADRFLSYKSDWGKDYENGKLILCDRYVGSNMIHQACKLEGEEKDKFLDWLDDFEFGIYSLPKPDLTLFLDMPPEKGRELIAARRNKIDNSEQHDIHERDSAYLEKSYHNACAVADKFGWTRVCCVDGDKIRTVEDISREICAIADKVLKN